MKLFKIGALVLMTAILMAGTASAAGDDAYRQQSDFGKMMHKLGRGVTNVVTCWVEIPRNIAIEWEKTDPVTGFVIGTVKGTGWTLARVVSGVYETVSFPFPVPADYEPLMEPEFVVTDIWGDPIPGLGEYSEVDPYRPDDSPVYPDRFSF